MSEQTTTKKHKEYFSFSHSDQWSEGINNFLLKARRIGKSKVCPASWPPGSLAIHRKRFQETGGYRSR